MDIKSMDEEFVANTYARFNLTAARGSGARITDEKGKEYIDLGSGIGVNAFGAADSQWREAVIGQLSRLQHLSNLYYTRPQAELARAMCEKTGFQKVFFSNSGAEANECAIKCARKYSFDQYGPGRSAIITLENSFHGRTMATLSATGQPDMHKRFSPLLPGFSYVPANDAGAMKARLKKGGVCGIMLELVQGEGGVLPLDKDYVSFVCGLARELDILVIVDEVQTGNGRTGTLYAYTQFGISPDIVTTAKGLGGGLPIGAALLGEKVRDTLGYGDHGSTYGGNPVCAAGALSVFSRLDDSLLEGVVRRGDYIRGRLAGVPGVTGITGLGLMLGLQVTAPAKEIVEKCIENGVIALTAKDKVRLLPPLNIPMEELALGMDRLIASIGQVSLIY